MIAVVVMLRVGPRAGGDVITLEALEAALPSVRRLANVRRAWIEGDALRAEIEWSCTDRYRPRWL